MREALLYLLPCVYAFLACIGFSMLFNIHGAGMLICAGGGALGWLCYLLTGPLVGNDIIQSFFAALVISAWSEVMARLRKCPVTSYLLVALFPLVPGGGIYYTMEHALNGDTELFLDTLMHTLGLAGRPSARRWRRRDCPPTGRPRRATYPSTGRSGTGWTGARCAGSGWW